MLSSIGQTYFWIGQLVEVGALVFVSYVGGVLATRHAVRVNYTRKLVHFSAFFVPVLVTDRFPFEPTPATTAVSAAILLFLLALVTHPVRSRSSFVTTVFRSFDRPEDRPHTLLWLTTQLIAGYAVIIPLAVTFNHLGLLPLIYIPILISGIGDGLAEPVGVRFGRRKYEVSALFSDRTYVRTLEGSACVFFSAIAVILFFRGMFTGPQLVAALTLVPASTTLAEARAPHTWDQPFLFLTGGLVLLGIVLWV